MLYVDMVECQQYIIITYKFLLSLQILAQHQDMLLKRNFSVRFVIQCNLLCLLFMYILICAHDQGKYPTTCFQVEEDVNCHVTN